MNLFIITTTTTLIVTLLYFIVSEIIEPFSEYIEKKVINNIKKYEFLNKKWLMKVLKIILKFVIFYIITFIIALFFLNIFISNQILSSDKTTSISVDEGKVSLKYSPNTKTEINILKKEIKYLGKKDNIHVYKVSLQVKFNNGNKNNELEMIKTDVILKDLVTGKEKVRTDNNKYVIQKNGYHLSNPVSYNVKFLEKMEKFELIVKSYFDNHIPIKVSAIVEIDNI